MMQIKCEVLFVPPAFASNVWGRKKGFSLSLSIKSQFRALKVQSTDDGSIIVLERGWRAGTIHNQAIINGTLFQTTTLL